MGGGARFENEREYEIVQTAEEYFDRLSCADGGYQRVTSADMGDGLAREGGGEMHW